MPSENSSKQFRFWLNGKKPEEKIIIDYIGELETTFAEHVKACLNFARVNGLDVTNMDTLAHRKIIADVDYKESHARHEKARADLAEWNMKFRQTFGIEPTSEAINALKYKAKQTQEVKEIANQTSEVILEKNYTRFSKISTDAESGKIIFECEICHIKQEFEQGWKNAQGNFKGMLDAHAEAKRHHAAMHMEQLQT